MKKLCIFSLMILMLLTGCSQNNISHEKTSPAESSYGVQNNGMPAKSNPPVPTIPESLSVAPGQFADLLSWMLIWYAQDGVYGEKMQRDDYQWLAQSPEVEGFLQYFDLRILTNGDIIGIVDLRPRAYPKGFDPKSQVKGIVSKLAEKKSN